MFLNTTHSNLKYMATVNALGKVVMLNEHLDGPFNILIVFRPAIIYI